jgi:lysophospholipase L1-like esterase
VEINRLGYRGLEVPPAKPAGGKRFLFLGDSNTFGYGIEEGERFSDLLGRSLPPGYDTVNLGVFGFGTDQEALLLESKGLAFAPDIVVLAFSAGDLSDNMSSVNGGAAKPFCRIENGRLAIRNVPVPRSSPLMKSSARASRLKTFFYRHSHIYRLLLTRIRGANLYMRDAVLEMDENEGLQVTSAIINGMDQVCRESGCRLVVLLISHGTWVTELQKSPGAPIGYYPALKVNLDQMGIPVIDTTDAFVRHPEGGLFFADDPVHLTRLGNRVAAEALYDGLSKLDMLPRR